MSQTDETPVIPDFEKELAALLNKHGMDNGANTPDFILARHLIRCIDTFRELTQEREAWFGTPLRITNDNVREQSTMGSETP
jgi:hypothetical protein